MVISQNVPALRTQLNMGRAGRMLADASRRLSSGFRINSAKDDPTGMAITNKLSLQLAGISKATDNASNGVALIQTAEGALSEVHNMLQRMRELAVQAANDTNTVEDRDKILTEVASLVDEIQSTTDKTEYNKIKILNGEANRISESFFTNGDKDMSVASIVYVSEDVQPGQLSYTIEEAGTPAVLQLDPPDDTVADLIPSNAQITINGIPITYEESGGFESLETKLTETLGYAGMEIQPVGPAPDPGDPDTRARVLMTTIAGSSRQIEISGDGALLKYLGLKATAKDKPVTGKDAVISGLKLTDVNDNPLAEPDTGLKYTSDGNRITIKGVNGEEIKINLAVSYDSASSVTAPPTPRFIFADKTEAATVTPANPPAAPETAITAPAAAKEMAVEFKDYGPIKIQVGGSYNNNISVYIPEMSAETLRLVEFRNGKSYNLLNYNTVHSASLAITQCDEALAVVSHVRSRLGASQNRLESTVRALGVAEENTNSSRSRIRDTDMAKEMTEYASQNVMYQAGISILTQANQRPMQVLSMLN